MFTVWILSAITLLSVGAIATQRSRKRRVDRLRAEWGRPASRTHRLDAMAESHASRVAVTHGRSLDARTWSDLNLDEVFSAIDRTESTLGQHALYHRLRTTPVADHLESFEAIVNRMSVDEVARERAQLARTGHDENSDRPSPALRRPGSAAQSRRDHRRNARPKARDDANSPVKR